MSDTKLSSENKVKVHIEAARSVEQLKEVAILFKAYAESLGIDLSFQSFEDELRSLPGKYAPPDGEIFLARLDNPLEQDQEAEEELELEQEHAGRSTAPVSSSSTPAIACVALRPISISTPQTKAGREGKVSFRYCEMKRLYVSPSGRGTGIGRKLSHIIIQTAKEKGYDFMLLDTLPHMTAALALYRYHGFVEVPAYYHNPIEGVIYLSLDLRIWTPR